MSERARERCTLRYYQSWLESSIGYRTASQVDGQDSRRRFHLDGSVLRASNDRGLIAFAQLGCLRLNVKRGIVTLISSSRQYILSEATKTTSLNPHHDNHDEGDELWFGNASLPRSQGISADALTPPMYTATGADGSQHSAPALIINDITLDSRYCDRGYAGNGVSFYCGVPLTTSAGFPIGVYTITDDKPRNGLAPEELRFMHDMAAVIMDHLDTIQNDSARFRGEKLVLGLGRFVQGESSIREGLRSDDTDSPQRSETLAASDGVQENPVFFKGMNITDADVNALRIHEGRTKIQQKKPLQEGDTMPAPKRSSTRENEVVKGEGLVQPLSHASSQDSATFVLEDKETVDTTDSSQPIEIATIFSRAASILRECASADGVVFYDAVSYNFAQGPPTADFTEAGDSATPGSTSSDSDPSLDSAFDSSDTGGSTSSGSLSGDDRHSHILSSRGKKCKMLGYSMDMASGSTSSANTLKSIAISESSLRRFIRRYPRGKMFYFSEKGDFSSDTDQSSVKSEIAQAIQDDTTARPKARRPAASTSSIAAELIQVVPGARSVMWLPLYDFTKQRWSAGCFLWSRRPDRLLNAQTDLMYMRTFASCIMGEIARVEAISADTARTTFIANISHELRSPLHGILGSIEFLQDTSLDDFQSSMTSAIETCGRTLLDTVESVLQYAKINDLLKKQGKRKLDGKHTHSQRQRDEESAFERDFDLALIVEDVVEAVYSGHTFISTGRIEDTFLSGDKDFQKAATTRMNVEQANANFSDAVKVILDIQRLDSWRVHGQPGAIRRIVMNLFGNALKYTKKGTITISLANEARESSSSKFFCITIKDTGIGMAPEFLQNHAFTAFTQESRFSVGAGLGLNIVRQLVHTMRGKVEVSSRQGVGTEVKVWLALPQAQLPPAAMDAGDLLTRVSLKTQGQTVCLIDPQVGENGTSDKASGPSRTLQSGLQDLLTQWFGLQPITASSMENVSADFFIYAEPPPIKYLLEHHGIHARKTEIPVIIMATNAFESSALLANGIHGLTDIGRVIEITSQPCGPQKLGKIFHRAMMRIAQLARDPQSHRTTNPASEDVVENGHAAEPYLGDSDSNQSVQRRLKRIHSDHPQPNKIDCATAAAAVDSSTAAKKEEGDESNNGHPSPISEQPAELEAEDYGFSADRDEPGPTLSPPPSQQQLPSRPKRPTMARQGTLSSSYAGPQDVSAQSTPDPTSPRVLLVDDNEINLKLLVAFMRKAHLPYETVRDGAEALEAYKRAASGDRFVHVIMDVSMPVMDGIAATREIRQFERKENMFPPANIVVLTGQASEITRKETMDAGADAFRTKPIKFKELLGVLEKSPE